MPTDKPIKVYKKTTLQSLQPDSLYAVKGVGENSVRIFITDLQGIPYPLKDENGNISIINNDGNILVNTVSGITSINLNSNIVDIINSALQSGNNISELTNDVGYITLSTDLEELENNSGNPFVRQDQLPANLNLYATNISSDVEGYFKVVSSIEDISFNDVAVDISTGDITTTNQLIASLVSESGVLIGNPGIVNITTIGNIRKVSGTGNAQFYFEVYKRNDLGVETLLTTSDNTIPITTTTYEQFSTTCLLNDGVFTTTDRIVLKFYGSRIPSGSNPAYNFQFGGSNPVRTTLPVPSTSLTISWENITGDIETQTDIIDFVVSKTKVNQTLVGNINGINNIFNISESIIVDTEEVFINGIKMSKPEEYVISGTTITLSFSPNIGETLTVNYIKQ